MSKTVEDHRKALARWKSGLRNGTKVRLKGWQIHWPQQDTKIVSISTDRTEAIVSPPICGRAAWALSDLSKPF